MVYFFVDVCRIFQILSLRNTKTFSEVENWQKTVYNNAGINVKGAAENFKEDRYGLVE